MSTTYEALPGNILAPYNAAQQERLASIDSMRVFLTMLVIAHHAAIAYGGAGDWPVKDPNIDQLTPIPLAIFNAINQSYFMSAFFLLAGYFTPTALLRKGIRQFILDRIIRLGIPLLVYSTIFVNLNAYMLDIYYHKISYQPILMYTPGHLWFLQALLVFASFSAVCYLLMPDFIAPTNDSAWQRPFPGNNTLQIWIVLLGLATFAIRLWFPVGVGFYGIQPGHIVHYVFAFVVGIAAYRHNWLNSMPAAQAQRWGLSTLAAIPLFMLLIMAAGALTDRANVETLPGGWHWEALAYALWESWLMIAMCMVLITFFRKHNQQHHRFARTLAANAYTVYILHQTILIGINIALLHAPIPTIVKFVIATTLTIVASFGMATLVRKLPWAQRVLS